MKYLSKLIFVLLLTAGLSGCSDYLKPSTPQNKPTESIETVQDLVGLINGAYSRLSQAELYGRDYVILGDVRTGNAFSNGSSGRFVNSAMFQLTPANAGGIWLSAYEVIANANLIIHSKVEGGEKVKQVKGQAYAVRALAHTILLKMYGQQFVDGKNLGIPYVTKFAGASNEKFLPSRLTVEKTIAKIEADYKKALSLLDPEVTQPATKLSYYGTKALMSRFYLFAGNYTAASAAAKDVIDSGVYSLVSADSYVSAWQKDGQPAVLFEIDFNTTDNRGSDSIFQIVAGDSYGDVEVTKELYQLFGSNDVRKGLYATESTNDDKNTDRLNYRVTGKYPDQYKNTPVIRYAEVILNYAEAQARRGNMGVALTYLNKITKHRNAKTYNKATVNNVLLERRKELAMEGHYYWQLLRTGQDIARNELRPMLEGNEITVSYGNFKLAYPIPLGEIDANTNIEQNKGYAGS